VDWCGTDETSANRVPDLQVSSLAQIHVVYAIPSDGADLFAQRAAPIATDIAAIDAWWRAQDPTRTPRFDLYPFPGCQATGKLDLAFVRLPHPGSFYLDSNADSDTRVHLISSDLAGIAPEPVKTLVYYDGPVTNAGICGQSRVRPSDGGVPSVALVWLQACSADLGQGSKTARVAAHELIHDLGAEPTVGPPHSCPPPDGGHPCDSPTDILYPFVSEGPLGTAVLDFGRDDYYGHSGTWWDVRNSPWLTHLPQITLDATALGSGSVGGVPGAASCEPGCSATLDNGLSVKLVPRPAAGAAFLGWSGACTGTGVCRVTMTEPKAVIALFGAKPKPKPKPKAKKL